MLGENKNLKDTQKDSIKDATSSIVPFAIPWQGSSVSYSKTNKLITGLYMVTDILDKDEPMRNRLRILGTGIISDTYTFPSSSKNLFAKISEILSLLDIASIVNIISQMNSGILKKEFLLLQESIREATESSGISMDKKVTLSEFLKDNEEDLFARVEKKGKKDNSQNFNSIGHTGHTRIGVQKGHTLMKALSKIEMSDKVYATSSGEQTLPPTKSFNNNISHVNNSESFNALKNSRREEIIKIIKNTPSGATITDIKTGAQGPLISCGEKTLQRELIAMVKDHVLYKTGEKRWSRYFVQN